MHRSLLLAIAVLWPLASLGQITIISDPADLVVPEGSQATFQVIFESKGTAQVAWYKVAGPNDIPVGNDQRSSASLTSEPRRPIYTARLTIGRTSMSDAGYYYCSISDASGQAISSRASHLSVKGLVAYWPLDGADIGEGVFLDQVSSHHLSASSQPQLAVGPDGRAEGAISVSGPCGWATVGPFDLTLGTGELTAVLWIRPIARIAYIPPDPNDPAAILDQVLQMDGRWHQVCMAFEGNDVQVYLDGWPSTQLDARTPSDTELLSALGINNPGRWPYRCELAQIRIYNARLDVAAVADLYEHVVCQQELVDPGAVSVHDPAIVRQGNTYYVFSTGKGIAMRRSTDLYHWEYIGRVFQDLPAWISQEVPGVSSLWAPDISYRDGRYYLYYAASTFGSNRSCIGLATNVTLDPADPDYRWVDHGKVIASTTSSNYNAIDGNVIEGADGRLWLAFGSFWTGIKLTELDRLTGKPIDASRLVPIASRPTTAIEAPFVIYRHSFYYLFVSFDLCCRGTDSTYNIRVGRAKQVTGPYYDKEGLPMTSGGGTLIVAGDQRWKGPGHNAILSDQGQDYLVYHAYDSQANGVSALRIRPLYWSDDLWPLPGPTIRSPILP